MTSTVAEVEPEDNYETFACTMTAYAICYKDIPGNIVSNCLPIWRDM